MVAGAGFAGSFIDLKTRRLPNLLTFGVAAAGLALAVTNQGPHTFWQALGGLGLGLALMLPGHVIGATGAGDVKFFAALGTLLGTSGVLFGFIYTAITGGVLALAIAALRGRLRHTVFTTAVLVGSRGANAAAIEHVASDNRFAYAPAIAIGTLMAALGI